MITITTVLLALLIGFAMAFVGVAWSCVIAEDDTPLNAYFKWLADWQHLGGWKSWVSSVLGGCHKCFTGQLSFWYSLFFSDLAWHLCFIAAGCGILSAFAIGVLYRWTNNKM